MDQNFVITIGRRIGAGGLETAGKLASEFGIKMYDKELIAEVARRSGISPEFFSHRDEKSSRGLGTLLHFRSPISGGAGSNSTVLTDERLFTIQSEVMQKIAAEESCIFVGRCADYVLRDHPQILNVFITADLDFRVARLRADHGWSDAEARRFIERGEKERADYYNYYTFKKWGDSASYDLCLDSSRLGSIDKVVDTIKHFMSQLW